jgi:hypothetical protein
MRCAVAALALLQAQEERKGRHFDVFGSNREKVQKRGRQFRSKRGDRCID